MHVWFLFGVSLMFNWPGERVNASSWILSDAWLVAPEAVGTVGYFGVSRGQLRPTYKTRVDLCFLLEKK